MNVGEIKELISRRRRQVLVHSIIYYRLNENLVSDYQWSQWAVELADLQKRYPEISQECCYAEAFQNFDPSTGYNLPLGDPHMNAVAEQLLRYHRENYLKGNKIMKKENWCGHEIRFVEFKGEWWANLLDICDALGLSAGKIEDVTSAENITSFCDDGVWTRIINEEGIYLALFASEKLEAHKFRTWSMEVLRKLRKAVGLEGYQAFRMTDEDVQDEIDHILDTLYWDEERKCVMQSITVPGGDVEQIPFE